MVPKKYQINRLIEYPWQYLWISGISDKSFTPMVYLTRE